MFKHFLITRFNIIQDWYTIANRNQADIQTDEWLKERFRLFERYCFPSVVNQSTKNFVWFVLFNANTPEVYKIQIESYIKQFNLFVPLFLEPYGNENLLVNEEINKRSNGCSHVITTRLDNDDMISSFYMQTIQDAFNEKMTDVFLNYGYGYQYTEKLKILRKYTNYGLSHYVSRVEKKCKTYQTVLVDHSKLYELGKYIELPTPKQGGWIEVIHSCNAYNRIDLRIPIYHEFNKPEFPDTITLSFSCYIKAKIEWLNKNGGKIIKHKIDKHIVKRIKSILPNNK